MRAELPSEQAAPTDESAPPEGAAASPAAESEGTLAGDEFFLGEHAAAGAPPERGRPYRHQPTLICPSCGAANPRHARQCQHCGASLADVARAADESPWQPPAYDLAEIMRTSWKIYSSELGLLIGCLLLEIVCALSVVALIGIPTALAAAALQQDAGIAVAAGLIVGIPLFLVLASALAVGRTQLYLNAARGANPRVADLFYGFGDGLPLVLRMLAVLLAVGGIVLLGYLLCCIPGIIVALVVWPVDRFLVDRQLSAGEALRITYDEIKANFANVILVGLVGFAIQTVSGMIPYLGVIVMLFTAPFILLLFTIGYLRLTAQRTAVD
jgi:hypothetical protein